MPRRRLRTFALWTGTRLSLLIAVAFVLSAWWFVVYHVGNVAGFIMAGSVTVEIGAFVVPSVVGWHSEGLRSWNLWTARSRFVEFPIYAAFLAVAIPTLLAWRFGPKPVKPGHCRCGYDLHGNESGVCPECGIEVQT